MIVIYIFVINIGITIKNIYIYIAELIGSSLHPMYIQEEKTYDLS